MRRLSRTARALLRSLGDLDIARMLRAKRLLRRRDASERGLNAILEKIRAKRLEMDRVDRRIRRLLSFTLKSRERNQDTLENRILEALAGSRQALGLTELAKALLARGYRTQSSFDNFRTSVAHALRKLRGRILRNERGYLAMPQEEERPLPAETVPSSS